MRLNTIRRPLLAGPRALLVVLLAFAIEIAPPPTAVVRHRPAHGKAPYVRAGNVIDPIRSERAEAGAASDGAPGLSAVPTETHPQLAAPMVVGAPPAIVSIAPPCLVAPLPPLVATDESPVTLRRGLARSRPARRA